jgi:hypothetical protein
MEDLTFLRHFGVIGPVRLGLARGFALFGLKGLFPLMDRCRE